MEAVLAEGLEEEEEQLVRRHRKEKKELQGEGHAGTWRSPDQGRALSRPVWGLLRGSQSAWSWTSLEERVASSLRLPFPAALGLLSRRWLPGLRRAAARLARGSSGAAVRGRLRAGLRTHTVPCPGSLS